MSSLGVALQALLHSPDNYQEMRSKENFLVFGQPLIEQDEIDEVVDSLCNAWLGTGPKVARFEAYFAGY